MSKREYMHQESMEKSSQSDKELKAISELIKNSDCDIFICRKCGRIDFRDTLDALGSEYGCCADCGCENHYEVDLWDLIKKIKSLRTVIRKCVKAMKGSNCLEQQWLENALKEN